MAQSNDTYQWEVEVVDEASRVLDRINGKVDNFAGTQDKLNKTQEKGQKSTSNLSSGFVALGGVTAGATAAIGATVAVGSKMISMAVDATVAINDWFQSISKATFEMIKNAEAAGVAAEEYQALSATFERFNADGEDLQDVLGTLADRANDATSGAQGMIEDFGLLGITVQDLKDKDPEELLDIFADGLQNMNDPTRRMAASARILGDDMTRKLLPLLSQGSQGLERFKQEAIDSGQVLSGEVLASVREFNRTMQEAQAMIDGLEKKVFATLVPSFNLLIDTFKNVITIVNDTRVSIEFLSQATFFFTQNALIAAIDGLITIGQTMQGIIKSIKWMGMGIAELGEVYLDLTFALDSVDDALIILNDAFRAFIEKTLQGTIDKLADTLDFFAKVARVSGKFKLAGLLQTASNSGKNLSDVLGNLADNDMANAEQRFQDLKNEAAQLKALFRENFLGAIDKELAGLDQGSRAAIEALKRLKKQVLQSSAFQPEATQDPSRTPLGPTGGGEGEELDFTGGFDQKEAARLRNEAKREELAALRLQKVMTEDELVKASIDYQMELLELQHSQVSEKEKEIERQRLSIELQKKYAEIESNQQEKRKESHEMTMEELSEQANYVSGTLSNAFNSIGSDAGSAFGGLTDDIGAITSDLAEMKDEGAEAGQIVASGASAGGQAIGGFLDAMGMGYREVAGIRAAFETAASVAAFASGNIPGGVAHASAAALFGGMAIGGKPKGDVKGEDSAPNASGGGTIDFERAFEANKQAYIEAQRELRRESRTFTVINDFTGATLLERDPTSNRKARETLNQGQNLQIGAI